MADKIVLVPLDGSANALCALSIARRLAEMRKASLHILHVTDADGSPAETAHSLGLEPADLRGATLEVRGGIPADGILAAAADHGASLIVMCAHAADAGPAIGAATMAVICGASCPVVLVNPTRTRGDWALRRVLAPHDGSPAVSGALRPATVLAREAGAELIVLPVADEAPAGETGSIAPPIYMDQVQHSWPAWSEEFLHRLATVSPVAEVQVGLRIGRGEPVAETIRIAGEAEIDLIVLAWNGHPESPDAANLTALVRDAPCPIMVTKKPGAAHG